MTKHVHSFAERHPDIKKQIMDTADYSSGFNDLCGRFTKLWDTLNELENEPVETERVRREVKHLERELLYMFHDQMRV